jgi:hypothetical protein
MAIIKITSVEREHHPIGEVTIVKKSEILFNTNEMIIASNYEIADGVIGSHIQYKRALIGSIFCVQTIEEIEELIKKNNN